MRWGKDVHPYAGLTRIRFIGLIAAYMRNLSPFDRGTPWNGLKVGDLMAEVKEEFYLLSSTSSLLLLPLSVALFICHLFRCW